MNSEINKSSVEWQISQGVTPYDEALAAMEQRVADIRAGTAGELIWLLQHPPLYTAGTSAQPGDLLTPDRFPVYETGRGGEYTYHGPGQRVGYVMLDLSQRGHDVRRFVRNLENWIMAALAEFGIKSDVHDGRVGVWVTQPDGREEKIAAIGVRVRKWVTFHGIAINVNPDLDHFGGIIPCGLPDHGVTSLAALGVKATMEDLDSALQKTFADAFAPTPSAERENLRA